MDTSCGDTQLAERPGEESRQGEIRTRPGSPPRRDGTAHSRSVISGRLGALPSAGAHGTSAVSWFSDVKFLPLLLLQHLPGSLLADGNPGGAHATT